jgi:hypothetical protein
MCWMQFAVVTCKTVANVGDNNIVVRLCVRVDDSVTPRDNKKKCPSPEVMAKQPRKVVTKRRKLQFLSESDSGQSDDESDDDNVYCTPFSACSRKYRNPFAKVYAQSETRHR